MGRDIYNKLLTMRFVITEEEKIRIKSLYEQTTSNPKNNQDPTTKFTSEELEILDHMRYHWKKDDFTNKPREANIICCGNYFITKIVSKVPVYTLSLDSEKTANISPEKGLYILFEDGSKLMKPNQYVGKGYSRGWYYYSSLNLNQQDLKTFMTKKIKKYRQSDVDTVPSSECSDKLMISLSALSKLNSEEFDYIFSGGAEKKNTSSSAYNQNDEPIDNQTNKEQKPEINASFPGGMGSKFSSYMINFLKNKIPSGNYNLKIDLTITKDGEVKDVKVISPEQTEYNQTFVDMFKSGPKWSPAISNGRQIDSVFRLEKVLSL